MLLLNFEEMYHTESNLVGIFHTLKINKNGKIFKAASEVSF